MSQDFRLFPLPLVLAAVRGSFSCAAFDRVLPAFFPLVGWLGVAKLPRGFWVRVKAGTIPHPQGQPIEGYAKVSNLITLSDSENASDHVLVRYNGKATCASSANHKLKNCMKKHGWNRNRGAQELRAYNGSVTAKQTESLIAAQNQLRHKQYYTKAKYYVDLVEPITHTVNFYKSA